MNGGVRAHLCWTVAQKLPKICETIGLHALTLNILRVIDIARGTKSLKISTNLKRAAKNSEEGLLRVSDIDRALLRVGIKGAAGVRV